METWFSKMISELEKEIAEEKRKNRDREEMEFRKELREHIGKVKIFIDEMLKAGFSKDFIEKFILESISKGGI